MELDDPSTNSEARELLKEVEGKRQKIAGKSIPDEKFAAKKGTLLYQDKNNNLLLIFVVILLIYR